MHIRIQYFTSLRSKLVSLDMQYYDFKIMLGGKGDKKYFSSSLKQFYLMDIIRIVIFDTSGKLTNMVTCEIKIKKDTILHQGVTFVIGKC